jgi:hypothetical protein
MEWEKGNAEPVPSVGSHPQDRDLRMRSILVYAS